MELATLHKEDIKAGLRKQFGTVRAFEIAQGLPKGSVGEVLRNRRWSKVERAIEAVIFPPLESLSEKPDSENGHASHSLNARAA